MNELQTKLLEMLSWFHKFCVEHDLTYYLSSGTMLGAVRHEGFIPWDDDLDVMMPREDINKLEKLMADKCDKYVFESPSSEAKDFLYSFPKIYDTTTTLIENTRHKIKRGIYIDIFPIDGMGNDLQDAEKHLKKIRRTFNLLLCKSTGIRKGRKLHKNLAVILFRLIPLNAKKLQKKLDSLCEERSWNDYVLSGNHASLTPMNEIVPKDVYGTPMIYKFEGIEVFGVEKYDEYLTKLYGEWRKLPPVEKRTSHHDFISIDLSKSYLSN